MSPSTGGQIESRMPSCDAGGSSSGDVRAARDLRIIEAFVAAARAARQRLALPEGAPLDVD